MPTGRDARHRRAHGCGLEGRSVVAQEDFQGLAEVLHEMEAINHLDGRGRASANAIGVEVAPIPADHRNCRMLREPCRDAGGRAVRQQVDDTMGRQIAEDRAIVMTPPPGPLINADSLQSWRMGRRRGPHQAEQGRRTGGELQTSGQAGAGVPAQCQADGPKNCGQSMGLSSIGCDEVRQTLGEHATHTGRVPAEELPDRELEMHGVRPPREIRQVALIATMDGR
jgi:hypothetical protein